MKPKRLLWISRHAPTKDQIKELQTVFGQRVEIMRVSTMIRRGNEVVKMMREKNCDEVVVVLPLQIQEQMMVEGVNPIRAVMREKNGILEHQYFERVDKIEVHSHRLLDERSYNEDV